MLPSSLFDMLV